jgi:TonB family protein
MEVIGTIAWIGEGQEAPPAAPAAQAETAAPSSKVYDVGGDVTAPQLIPVQWEVMAVDTRKEAKDGLVSLTLVVDAEGVPQGIAVASPRSSTLEKMAQRIANADRFKPGTLKGEPVAVRRTAEVSIKGCFATKTDEAGNTTDVFRLTAQPVQQFGVLPLATDAGQHEIGIAAGSGSPRSLSRVGGKVSAPSVLNSVEAHYSDEAKHKEIQGVCLVQMIADAQGKPQNPRVVRSLGYGLDEKAIEAANKMKFKPAMKDGKTPVPVMITVEVNFRLY